MADPKRPQDISSPANAQSVGSPSAPERSTLGKGTPGESRFRARSWSLVLVGTLAAALAWGPIQFWVPTVGEFSEEMRIKAQQAYGNPPIQAEVEAAERKIQLNRTVLAFVAFGAILSAALGVGIAFLHGRPVKALTCGLLGALLGGAFGALAGLSTFHAAEQLKSVYALRETRGLIVHAIAWVLIGPAVAVTAAAAVRLRGVLKALCAALLAGVAASVTYGILAALIFPTEPTGQIVPQGRWNQLFWLGIAAAFIAYSVGRTLAREAPAAASTAHGPTTA